MRLIYRVFDFGTESLEEQGRATGSLADRLNVFEKLMTGQTGAKLDEKKAACEAFKTVINQARKSNNLETKNKISTTLSQILLKTEDAGLKLDIMNLQDYLETGSSLDAEIDRFVDEGGFHGDVVDDDYMRVKSDSFVIEEDNLFESGEVIIPGADDEVSFVEPRNVPTPLADALDGLAGRIKATDGAELPAIAEMKELLEAGTQPVVLLEKLEKLYDSSSVKYSDANKQAVREAAKEIYDKGMHGQSSMLRDSNRIVDALVGLEFEGIHAMRLGEAESPLKL